MGEPKFLWSGEEEWTVYQELGQGGVEDDLEVKKVKLNMIMVDGDRKAMNQREDVTQVKKGDEVKAEKEDEMNEVEHFSSWYKLKKAIAWILRIKKHLIQKSRERKQVSKSSTHSGDSQQANQDRRKDTVNRKLPNMPKTQESGIHPHTVSDMKEAERAAIEFAQRRAFPKEITILKRKLGSLGNKSSR